MDAGDFKLFYGEKVHIIDDQCPEEGTAEMGGWCAGIIQGLNLASVAYSDFPIFGFGGIIQGMTKESLAALIVTNVGYPFVSPILLSHCDALVNSFATAICNAGSIENLDATAMAGLIALAHAQPITPEIQAQADAISEYVMANAEVATGAPLIVGAIT